MKIGLLVVVANKYIRFLAPLARSAERHFLKNHEITLFIFTDHAGVMKRFLTGDLAKT